MPCEFLCGRFSKLKEGRSHRGTLNQQGDKWFFFSALKFFSFQNLIYLLEVHTLLSQDGSHRGEFWEVGGHMASPFDLYQTLPVGYSLLLSCSLPGLPVIK